jgi:hypothetical protein
VRGRGLGNPWFMSLRRRRTATDPAVADDANVVAEPGVSLAKGPALIAGAILVAFGLASLLKNSAFPSFSSSFPDGDVQGTNFLGIEVNGWTAFFSITAGALLMFGAAQHHLAKLMSLLVGLALAACAVIAIIDGQDVLGLAAANTWTKVGFAVAGGAMLLNALMPRTTRRRTVETAPVRREPVADETPTTAGRRTADDEAATTVGRRTTADPTADAAPTTVGRRTTTVEPTADEAPTTVGEPAAPTTAHRRGRFFRSRSRETTVADPPPRA